MEETKKNTKEVFSSPRFSGAPHPGQTMQKLLSYFFITVFFVISFFLINNSSKNLTPENIRYVKIARQSIKVELAVTAAEQERGLSGGVPLKDNEGMLFIFEKPNEYSFWMKDMNFPIDIIWIGEDLKVVYIKKDARPELYPETYAPDGDAKYVLEVVSGFSDKNNFKVGDKVEFGY